MALDKQDRIDTEPVITPEQAERFLATVRRGYRLAEDVWGHLDDPFLVAFERLAPRILKSCVSAVSLPDPFPRIFHMPQINPSLASNPPRNTPELSKVQPLIHELVTDMHSRLTDLECAWAELENRLGWVMSPAPSVPNESGEAPPPAHSGLAEILTLTNNQIVRQLQILRDCIARLEI